MFCHNLEVMGSNPSWTELGVRWTSVLLEQKIMKVLVHKENSRDAQNAYCPQNQVIVI